MRKLRWFPESFVNTCFIIPLCLCSSFTANKAGLSTQSLKVLDLKCEYASDPIGLDEQSPQLSWRMESVNRGVLQTAYQIIVASTPENLALDRGDIWDSEKISASRSSGVSYQGKELTSRERYYWKVRIWDSKNNLSNWSEPAFFEMGLLKQEDWNADWIGFAPGRSGQVLYFKHCLHIDKEVRKARAYVSGIGYYEFHINGKKAGDHVLDPATCDYNKRVYYATYDIADFLEKENAFVVTVGPGWYGIPKLKMLVELSYADGTFESFSSNDMRTVTTGPITRSSIYDGETYDAREETPDFYTSLIPSFLMNDKWGFAPLADDPGGRMVSQKMEPIKITATLIPEIIREPVQGIYVIDAGQNLAGWASLKVRGEKGMVITLKFAETLYKNGTVNQENLRSAKALDTYILRGEGEEQWEPAFTYHGFRYIQVEGFPYAPKIGDISVKVVRSAVNPVGKFNCSSDLLNRIHKMVVSTEASNLHSIPTDCPQRDERMGWLNDLTVRIEQALYNFDLSRFYSKFIDDIGDTQGEDGRITDTAPYRYGSKPADPVSASYLLLAFKSYEFYGNEKIVREHYKGMKAWVDYLNSRTEDGIVNYSYYGDWCPLLNLV
jgi:alpha-L-rhamnosidase